MAYPDAVATEAVAPALGLVNVNQNGDSTDDVRYIFDAGGAAPQAGVAARLVNNSDSAVDVGVVAVLHSEALRERVAEAGTASFAGAQG